MTNSFSVLICTYNRPALLELTLKALLIAATEKPDQVIVVNGGDERTDHIVNQYERVQGTEVRLVKTFNKNLATSRNVGISHCQTDIVAMTDDDAEVFPDWVTRMKQTHANYPEAGAVGGAVIGADSPTSLLSRISDVVTFPQPKQSDYVRNLPGVNVSYKGELLHRIGPQDETLPRGEDVDFNWRLQKMGYRLYFDPDIKVLHHHRPTLRALVRQHYMYGRGYCMVRRKWPEMYCVYPREFRRPKDFLKLVNFGLATFYQPFLSARRLTDPFDRIRAVPIMMANQVAWRSGMIQQLLINRRSSGPV